MSDSERQSTDATESLTLQEERLFRLEEANAMVPLLTEMFTSIRSEIESAQRMMKELGDAGYHVQSDAPLRLDLTAPAEAQQLQRDLVDSTRSLEEKLSEVRELGVLVKGIDGLVDFRSRYDDRVVDLCWKFGEDTITHWHDIDAGFAGRQPIVQGEEFEGGYLQ